MVNPKKLARKVLPGSGVKLAEESYRRSRLLLTQARYGFPARDLRIIAVTGTNGKTTTCMLINAMLKSAGYRTAVLTTAIYEMDGKSEINKNHRTVPLTADLFNFFKTAKQKQVDFVILEVTSQALQQHKMRGIPVEVAVMTNLTQDHLDYHGTMQNYAAAKARLFNAYMDPNYCVLNRDDQWFKYFERQCVGAVTTYGQSRGSEVAIGAIKPTKTGSDFTRNIEGKPVKISLQLPGTFNVYNAAAAAAVGCELGLTADKIAKGLASLTGVPGRMERVDAGQNFTVLVDYAITPDALAQAIQAVRPNAGRVLVVFGATGDRDKSKRPLMGHAAADYADLIYLTDDETYTEDSEAIRQAVYEGIVQAKGKAKTKTIPDRREAIKAAFKDAKKGDVVLLTGLGHQDSRNMGGKNVPWNEHKVAIELLKKSK